MYATLEFIYLPIQQENKGKKCAIEIFVYLHLGKNQKFRVYKIIYKYMKLC